MDKLRIDKWLWAARFYKTRSLAVEEIDKGRVHINTHEVKPSREVKVGDTVALRQGPITRTLVVRGISSQRGAAPSPSSCMKKPKKACSSRRRPQSSGTSRATRPAAWSMADPPNATGAAWTRRKAKNGTTAGAHRLTSKPLRFW